MHAVFLFGAIAYATLLAVVAFFVFFAAERAAGKLKTFGRALAVWICLLALIAALGAAVSPWLGVRAGSYGPGMMGGRYPGWMHQGPQLPPPASPSGAP